MAKLTGVKTIDMVGGEITKVEYNGELYSKVGGDAKQYDLAKANKDGLDITSGGFYVVEDTSLSIFSFTDDENDENSWDFDGTFTFYRKEATKGNPTDSPSLESRVETLETKVAALGGAEQKVESLKVGEYAKVISIMQRNGKERIDVSVGDVGLIIETDGSDIPYRFKRKIDGLITWFVSEGALVKASDEEVAEAQAMERWSAIGRKPNEFKEGDIVRAVRNLGDGETIVGEMYDRGEPDSNGHYGINGLVDGEYRSVRDVELITPVESRFDK